MPYIIPASEPFFFPGGRFGCILMHGFSAMPEEMLPLGKFLSSAGFSVMGIRLAGHATLPADLQRTAWTDWLVNVEEGLAFLAKSCSQVAFIGQSMGGMIALLAAARYRVTAVVAMSTPYEPPSDVHSPSQTRRPMPLTIRKRVKRFPKGHPLNQRRELNYPAYPEFPSSILGELDQLAQAMTIALPQVQVPTLLIHSRNDHAVPFACMQMIHDHLGSPQKKMIAFDSMGHSLVQDPQYQQVFDAVLGFLKSLG